MRIDDVRMRLDGKNDFLRKLSPGLIACLLGVLAFAIWNGGHTFSPTHIGWIMSGLDTPAHYLGWEFFRNAPWLQWPAGFNPEYGMDAPGTIVMTDSIPIMAFLFKLLNHALPADFQYFGIWLLCCFLLQAWFGYRLMGRLTPDPLLRLLGVGFFLASPIFLMRVYLHPALAGQWILLAAMYLSLDARFRSRAWSILLVTAALVHAYLLAMAGAIWLASMFGRACHRSERVLLIARHVCLVLAMVVLTMWIVGYFVASAVMPTQNVSHTNLLTFALTGACGLAEWSKFLPCINLKPDVAMKTGDGFGYFGLGFLLLLPVGLVLRPLRLKVADCVVPSRVWWPLVLACLLLLLYAIGNCVYLGNYLLLSFDLPEPVERVWTVFRGAARMEWPAWYLMLLITLGVVISRLHRTAARAVLAIALVVQCLDLSSMAIGIHEGMAKRSHFQNALTASAWSELASYHSHVAYLPAPGVSPYLVAWIPSYRQLAHYAALHDLTINVAYLARLDLETLAATRARREALLAKGQSEPSTFYVVEDAALWPQILCAPNNGQWHGRIDGLPVVVPDPKDAANLPPAEPCMAEHVPG
jgi:hypothetical protein